MNQKIDNDNVAGGIFVLSTIAALGCGLIAHSVGVTLLAFVFFFLLFAIICSIESSHTHIEYDCTQNEDEQ